ncbi:hypothetical protein Q73A0000_05620 [Kaistella flava (ex Peng et al. 2021)]|uniref:Uncharacterized protein n=1 Tax=Kaistella flava (ex Peng et al. 2021) TaxID=2038776 RepID=A0A7M2Y6K5_9FLAO|nr:hypothetical protein [Kaistella flava (ex Peng et al. 2021)]QOW09877.1 hypothetical protein Q73A0000_05620 [Kaistella flava (ex Peng et al. 2021)]
MKFSICSLVSFILCFNCCSKNEDIYNLKSQLKKVPSKLLRFGTKEEYINSQYKIDYSEKGYIKIAYLNNSISQNKINAVKLLRVKNKYYNGYDLDEKDSLNTNSYLYLSLNPNDSYQRIYNLKTSDDTPPPPYEFPVYNDSIIFKKNGNLTKMFIKDNNTNRIKSTIIYYDSNFRIKKIEQKIYDVIINYE